MPCRQTIYAKKLRAVLIEKMGGKCALCAEADAAALEFDHINGPCNKAMRIKNDNGAHIRTEHGSLVPLTPEMPF